MAMVEERLLFENEDWAVIDSGLEHKRTGYFIEREVISQRRTDGLWLWPLHVAEKSWCRMATFTEAFSCAASAYGVAADVDLARSFMTARCDVADWPRISPLAESAPVPIAKDIDRPYPILARPRAPLPRPAALSPGPTRGIRRAGTRLVRLLQAAWNKK